MTTAVLVVAALAAGCGGSPHRAAPPKLPAALADDLARKSDEVAQKLSAGDACGALASAQELQARANAAVGAHEVPRRLQEPLLTSAGDLTRRIYCAPPDKKPPKHEHEHHGKGKKH